MYMTSSISAGRQKLQTFFQLKYEFYEFKENSAEFCSCHSGRGGFVLTVKRRLLAQ